MRLEFSRQIFEKKAEISSFTKPRLVAAELFHADGQTDMKLIVAFRNFPNATKKIVLGVPPGKKKKKLGREDSACGANRGRHVRQPIQRLCTLLTHCTCVFHISIPTNKEFLTLH
jgi:hypothetical protein